VLSVLHLTIVLSVLLHLTIVLSVLLHLTIVLSVILHLAIVLSVLLHLAIVLSVLQFTECNYTFVIVELLYMSCVTIIYVGITIFYTASDYLFGITILYTVCLHSNNEKFQINLVCKAFNVNCLCTEEIYNVVTNNLKKKYVS
jgi:predicted membrane protein